MQLAGIDASRQMLAIARRKLGPSLELQVAWAELLPYPYEMFDVVVSCSGFHYLREPVSALQDMARVVKPGGSPEAPTQDAAEQYGVKAVVFTAQKPAA